jgi:hypothetical protein
MINQTIVDIALATAGNLDSFAEAVPPDPMATACDLSLFRKTAECQDHTIFHHDPTHG